MPLSPLIGFLAASARDGLVTLVDQTQDVVSQWTQDYARNGLLSRLSVIFLYSVLMIKFNWL